MSRGLSYFFLFVIFMLGLSIGVYTGSEMRKEDIIENDNRVAKTVQDIVLKTVQSGDFLSKTLAYDGARVQVDSKVNSGEIGKSGDNNFVEASANEIKISPYATMIIKKRFKKCNHTTVNMIDIPKEIINLTESELAKKYDGWDIEKFSADEVILSREIEANCEDHYVLKDKEGYIAVYNELTDNRLNLVEVLNVDTSLLGEEDKKDLKEGIKVYGKEDLSSLIEDYNS